MSGCKHIVGLILFLLPLLLVGQESLRISRGAVVSHNVGLLAWNQVACDSFTVYRQFPDQEDYHIIATLSSQDTSYTDTLRRVICADSVNYYVAAHSLADTLQSDTVGLYYRDDVPTEPCSLRLCSVDTASGQILLSWYPSPDTDVMGYYIVYGVPSRGLDTVWGRLNTHYRCSYDLTGPSVQSQFDFRVLAFDSCYQASPLTPYYHNPLLQFTAPGCSRLFRCSWNRYIHMPDSVGQYVVHYRLAESDTEYTFTCGPDGPYSFETEIPDLSVDQVQVYLEVVSTSDSLRAYSPWQVFQFPPVQTAAYLTISDTQFLDTESAIQLTIDVDPDYPGAQVQLYRRRSGRMDFEPLALLDHQLGQSQIIYIDFDVHRAVPYYTYRAVAEDPCHLAQTESDTVQVVLPQIFAPAIYFPNVIIYGHPDAGKFCPQYLSPLAADYRLSIFNRLGERVFHTTSLTDCWSGTRPDGTPLPQGTYVFVAHCRHADGSTKQYHGTVTLIR